MGAEREEAERPTVELLTGAPRVTSAPSPLRVGPAGDTHERDADRIADHAVRALRSTGPASASTPAGDARVQRSSAVTPLAPTTDLNTGTRAQRSHAPTPLADTVRRMPEDRIQRRLADITTAGLARTPLQEIQAIDPKELDGDAYRVLHDGMHQSWHEAKHVLAAGKLPDGETTAEQSVALKAMMQKLWDYRQWHHELVLQDTRRRVNAMTNDPEGLKEWKAAGSTSLTSDIDVNLKGNQTELAVKVFNETFKEFGWNYEAGIVYDVNVYAMDFMHGIGQQTDAGLMVSQEGRRAGSIAGGVDEGWLAADDRSLQREWTLVKTRLHMTPSEWDDFKSASGGNGWDRATFAAAERRFEQFKQELTGAMGAEVHRTITAAEATEQTGAESIHAAAEARTKAGGNADDVAMAASNRVYEAKLDQVAHHRRALTLAIARYHSLMAPRTAPLPPDGGPDLPTTREQVNLLLVGLRDLLSECSLFANEAYLTHGAVNHGVVGLQVGKPIAMTNSAMYDAFQENLADSLKEIARHGGSIGEAAYKSGKYIWRMADAADNLGVDVEEKRWLLTAGGQIANDVKNGKADPEEASARLVDQWLGVKTVDELRQAVIGFGMVVGAQYNETIGKQKSAANAKPIEKDNWKR